MPRVDYERHGRTYTRHRRTDPRIAARVKAALGNAHTVVNVGAGAGSHEPDDRWVLAIEPSATMRSQRGPYAAPAIDGRAEALPFDDDGVDAAMACITIHHWEPLHVGLAELRRVARERAVVLTFDLDGLPPWQLEFLDAGLFSSAPRGGAGLWGIGCGAWPPPWTARIPWVVAIDRVREPPLTKGGFLGLPG